MLSDNSAVRAYFAKLGLEQEVADIYVALHAQGPQSISQLSRTSKVERTRIYRLIDTLLDSNLIEVETRAARGIIKAAPIANLHILIKQKEQELQSLHDELELIQHVLARNSLSSPLARVQFYYGQEGVRQMLENEQNATSEIIGYEKHNDGVNKLVKGTTYRYISPKDFAITHTCHVYDAVMASYHQKNDEAFGVETYCKEIADSQRQLLELLWTRAAAYDSSTATSRQKAT